MAAAGNGNQYEIGYDIDRHPVYPASFPYDNIITTGNLLFNGHLDESSNYGQINVDLAAPGTYILSTVPADTYAYMTGTSMGWLPWSQAQRLFSTPVVRISAFQM